MTKEEFLTALKEKLKGLPQKDIEERVSFYEEAINDRIDEGKSEEEAVADIGSVDLIVEEIARDTPLMTLVKERITPKRKIEPWEIVLLILGFPLWFPLALTALILALVFYLLIWVGVIVVYSVELALVVSAFASLIAFFANLFTGSFNPVIFGAIFMCAGGATLLAFGCIGVTKGTLQLSKSLITKIKTVFIRKGE